MGEDGQISQCGVDLIIYVCRICIICTLGIGSVYSLVGGGDG